MERFGSELVFISRVNRDGNGTEQIEDTVVAKKQNTNFKLMPLSITLGTFIACDFFCYVVKLKNPPPSDHA